MRNKRNMNTPSVQMPEDIVREGLAVMLKTLGRYEVSDVQALAKEFTVILDKWYREKIRQRDKTI